MANEPQYLRGETATSSAAKPVVLLVGEASFVALLKYIVEREGFQALATSRPDEVALLADVREPDLIAIDLALKQGAGWSACEAVCAKARPRKTSILLLGAENGQQPDLPALGTEPVEYLQKPFPPGEFILRIRNMLKPDKPAEKQILCFRDIVMDLEAHRVFRNGRNVHLGPVEYRLLYHLLRNPGRVFTRAQLLEAAWGRNIHVIPRTVDVHMSRIRKALNANGEPNSIRTVRATGYSLDVDA